MRYRFENEVFHFWQTLVDEVRLLEYRESKGRAADYSDRFDMNVHELVEMRDAFKWLCDITSHRPLKPVEERNHPNDEVLLKGFQIIKESGEALLRVYAKSGPPSDMKTRMRKYGRREIGCAEYYSKLIKAEFFRQPELKRADLFRIIK